TVTISLSAEINGTDNDFGIDNICITPCCTSVNGDFSLSVPNNGTGNGWTTSDIGSGGWTAAGGYPGGYFHLNETGGASDPTASQTFGGLTPGACYIVNGFYASIVRNMSPIGVDSFRVSVDGSIVFTAQPTALHHWTPFAGCFEAPASGV